MRTAIIIISTIIAVGGGTAGAAECSSIKKKARGNTTLAERIVRSGSYCMIEDIKAARRYDFGGERAKLVALLSIQSPAVDIDLRGLTLHADTLNLAGIWLSAPYGVELRQVTLRNGRLISRTQSAIEFPELMGTTLADFRVVYQTPAFAEEAHAEFRNKWAKEAASMQPSEILIDGLSIQSNTRSDDRACGDCFGVALKGQRNVIRNSRIEVSNAQAGLLFVGPDNLIEHCTIVFKGKAATEAAAAIKLYGAHNTVIRDNDIVIESDDDTAPVAILLTDSKNVTLEGNRFYGVKTITKMDEQSSYAVERGNQSLSRFKALFIK